MGFDYKKQVIKEILYILHKKYGNSDINDVDYLSQLIIKDIEDVFDKYNLPEFEKSIVVGIISEKERIK